MVNVKTRVISVIIGGDWNHLRVTHKLPEPHTEREHEIEKLQKRAILGTAHILL